MHYDMALPQLLSPLATEDRALVRQLRQGSPEALGRIYDKHKTSLLRLAASLLIEDSQAEDVVHEVFLRIAREPSTINGSGNLRGFLSTCVANRARNLNRSGRRFDASVEVEAISTDERSPARWLVANDDFDTLRRALSRLPYEQREVIALHLQGDLPFREIARITNVSINTALSRYRYGLNKLRNELKGGF